MPTHAIEGVAPTLIVEQDVPTPMRDGTVLRADIYRPVGNGPYPVLVHRIPYGKQNPMAITNLMLPPISAVNRGYAVVVQDTRGRYSSDGTWDPLRCEGDDGYDTVEWAAGQPWSSGAVGIYGSSYMGVTVLQTVASDPPSLVTAAAYMTGGNYHDGWVYTGGALELLFNLRWAAGQALGEAWRAEIDSDTKVRAIARLRWIAENPGEAMRFTPLRDVFGEADVLVGYWKEWIEHPTYDAFWETIDLTKSLTEANVPVLNIAGWHDGFLKGHLQVIDALHGQDGESGARHRALIGPWDHEAYQGMRPNAAGDDFFGLAAVGGAAGLQELVLDWFDEWMKDEAVDAAGAPVRYFMMGPNEWVDTDVWPPARDFTELWLTSGGEANTRNGDGALADETPAQASVDVFVYDPTDPVPTAGGRHLGYWYGRAGVQDQAEIELRPDVLVYTGPVLERPFDLVGGVVAHLYVRSTAANTDFSVKLVDVRPGGYCANVAEGIARVDIASPMDGPEDEAQLVVVDLWPTAYRFGVGHRIRVEVSSSNFPRFDRNGNTGGVPATTKEADWVSATQHLLTGNDHPSRLLLGGTPPTG